MTTYRKMAEDAVNQAALVAGWRSALARRPICVYTAGATAKASAASARRGRSVGGLRNRCGVLQRWSKSIPLERTTSSSLPYRGAEVVWAVRQEWRARWKTCSRAGPALFSWTRGPARRSLGVAHLTAKESGVIRSGKPNRQSRSASWREVTCLVSIILAAGSRLAFDRGHG